MARWQYLESETFYTEQLFLLYILLKQRLLARRLTNTQELYQVMVRLYLGMRSQLSCKIYT